MRQLRKEAALKTVGSETKRVIFTVASNNYLSKAMVLAASCRQHMPDAILVLYLIENALPSVIGEGSDFDFVLVADEIAIPRFKNFIFRHDVTEASTAVKASLFRYLFSTFPVEQVIYLDPDIQVFSAFEEVFHVGRNRPIIVTPHHLRDEPTYQGIRDNVFRTLKCGVFNLGFLALTRSDEAIQFLDWWDSRLMMLCYVDFDRGLFVDQKWMDLAPCFFDVHILKHSGYNVANWNVSQRPVRAINGNLTADDEPLRFFHFSGIATGKDLRIFTKYCVGEFETPLRLRMEYLESLKRRKEHSLVNTEWSYDKFYSGERILFDARFCCRMNQTLRDKYEDPFEQSNEAFISVGW